MAVTEGQLISDGTAVWKVKKIGNGELSAGTVQMFAGNSIPAGWLLCDGSAISRTDYAELFEVIGTTYGAGDGSTTFNLPNTIGRFAEGADSAGGYHEAGLPNITGSTICTNRVLYSSASGAFSSKGTGLIPNASSSGTGTTLYMDASKSNSIYGNSTTVQPNSFTVQYIIKY